jgi:two-component system cell cycle sensor histidine kinase/response regulator CckA
MTVLVVDDEAPVRSLAQQMLERIGCEVREMADGFEALAQLEQGGLKADAILLDMYMPYLSGMETFQRLRAAGHAVPVILCSGYSIDPDEFVLLSQQNQPPVDMVVKPYSLPALAKALERAAASVPAAEEQEEPNPARHGVAGSRIPASEMAAVG